MLVKRVCTQWLLVVAQYMCVWVLNVWTTFQPVLVNTFDNTLLFAVPRVCLGRIFCEYLFYTLTTAASVAEYLSTQFL